MTPFNPVAELDPVVIRSRLVEAAVRAPVELLRDVRPFAGAGVYLLYSDAPTGLYAPWGPATASEASDVGTTPRAETTVPASLGGPDLSEGVGRLRDRLRPLAGGAVASATDVTPDLFGPPRVHLSVGRDPWGFTAPLYAGKATPSGGRKGLVSGSVGDRLYRRLRDHCKSLERAEGEDIQLDHLWCRRLVLDAAWVALAEESLIQHFTPVWNLVLDGFGNHDLGATRSSQQRAPWDRLHPGRHGQRAQGAATMPGHDALELRGRVMAAAPRAYTAVMLGLPGAAVSRDDQLTLDGFTSAAPARTDVRPDPGACAATTSDLGPDVSLGRTPGGRVGVPGLSRLTPSLSRDPAPSRVVAAPLGPPTAGLHGVARRLSA